MQSQTEDIVQPPWEAFVAAGPNAENDIDLETLNGPNAEAAPIPETPIAPLQTPSDPPPTPAQKTARVENQKAKVEINSVAVPSVTGAKGAGNAELTKAMRAALQAAGWPVLVKPSENALTIRGTVVLSAAVGATQKIDISWVVFTPEGKSLGDVKQANQVAAGSLDAGFGANADFAAQAAAEGIFKLIQNYR